MKSSRGFTLIELLVVIVIVAILAMLALPSFSAALNRQRLTAVAEELQGHFYLAKMEAVRTSKPVFISTSQAGPNACYGFNVGAPCDCSVAPDQPEACGLARGGSTAAVHMASNTFEPAVIDPVRGAVTGAGRVTWQAKDGQSRTVGITSVGRVFTCSKSQPC